MNDKENALADLSELEAYICNRFKDTGIGTYEHEQFLRWGRAVAKAEEVLKEQSQPKRESQRMLPCKCGYNRRERWYGLDENRNHIVMLKCKKCGFRIVGKNEADAIRNWNAAVSEYVP